MSERRHLLGILVYNGLDVVPRCLESAAALVSDSVDVMVFDDCSPAPGWSDAVEAMCARLGIGYYRSPRNLGIPRNMNLVMKTALAGAYDAAGLVNSDVVLPTNLVAAIDAAFDAGRHNGARVASVTPWSNNVSAFSLPMGGAMPTLADVEFVSALSRALATVNGSATIDIPTGVGYCLAVSADAIREVGIMDPIFGRGYCEEVDWCQRARLAGYRNVLSLGSFVFHEGSGTNREEGLLAHGMTTIAEHELIILGRYPDYRTNIDRFLDERNLEELGTEALSRALTLLARESGYELVVSDSHSTVTTGAVRVLMPGDDARRPAHVSINGVSAPLSPPEPSAPGLRWWSPQAIEDVVGLPTVVEVFEPGAAGKAVSEWARSAGIAVIDHVSYPTRI